MDILQIAGLGIVSTMIILVLKAQRPEIAFQISIFTGVVIFMLIAAKLGAVVQMLVAYMNKFNINSIYVGLLLKIIGIAYIAEFAAEVCRDAGEGSIAIKIELAAKAMIMIIAVPILTTLLDLIISIMP